MHLSVRALLSVIACLLGVIATDPAASADAAQYPTRPIRMVIPWSPGGSTDVLGRVLADNMGRALGVPIVVENNAGATGTIGFAQVARAVGDGYTMLLGTNSTFAIAPHFYSKLPYNLEADFVAVGMIGSNPQILCVLPGMAAKTLAEFVLYAKQKPGELAYASSGVGGSSHLAMELLMSTTGINMLHVPYRGGAPALTALLGGEVHVGFVDISTAGPLIRGGKLRTLGTSGTTRMHSMPDTPTLAEAGAPGFESVTSFGLFMPAGTPAGIVARVNTVLNSVLRDPQAIEKLGALGFELTGGAPDTYKAYAIVESKKWETLIKQRHIVLP